MIRTIALAMLFSLCAFSSALAADTAERRIIGFSPDGKWFAFEQFGVQDGSGFPFHHVFIIDVVNDKWAPGTPIYERIDDETATSLQVRNKARVKAAPELAKLKIINPGFLLASNPVTEVGSDANRIGFRTVRNWVGPPPEKFTLRLQTTTTAKPESCAYSDSELKLFSLTLAFEDNPPKQVYADKHLPSSRGCAHDYRISDVLIHEENFKPERFVVLIQVYTQGFEGSDLNYMAVPVAVPDALQ